MKKRTIALAEQLLNTVPAEEIQDLIRLLAYYNRFAPTDRVTAMRNGSHNPEDPDLEAVVMNETRMLKTAASQHGYVTTNQMVCRCCGK